MGDAEALYAEAHALASTNAPLVLLEQEDRQAVVERHEGHGGHRSVVRGSCVRSSYRRPSVFFAGGGHERGLCEQSLKNAGQNAEEDEMQTVGAFTN